MDLLVTAEDLGGDVEQHDHVGLALVAALQEGSHVPAHEVQDRHHDLLDVVDRPVVQHQQQRAAEAPHVRRDGVSVVGEAGDHVHRAVDVLVQLVALHQQPAQRGAYY